MDTIKTEKTLKMIYCYQGEEGHKNTTKLLGGGGNQVNFYVSQLNSFVKTVYN